MAMLGVLALTLSAGSYCAADDSTAEVVCRNRIRNAKNALRLATNEANKAQRLFENNEKKCTKWTDKIDSFFNKAADKCASRTDKLDTFVSDSEAKRTQLEGDLDIARKEEDKAKECFGLIGIGDLCGGKSLESARRKRRRLEVRLAAFESRYTVKLNMYTRRKDVACTLATTPAEQNTNPTVVMLVRNKTNACAKRDELAAELPGLATIVTEKQAAYDAALQECVYV